MAVHDVDLVAVDMGVDGLDLGREPAEVAIEDRCHDLVGHGRSLLLSGLPYSLERRAGYLNVSP